MSLIFYLWLGLVSSGRLDVELFSPPTITGMYTVDALLAGDFPLFLNALKHLIIPAFVLGLQGDAVIMRLTRASMLEVLRSDYITLAKNEEFTRKSSDLQARVKKRSAAHNHLRGVAIWRHAIRSMIPTL